MYRLLISLCAALCFAGAAYGAFTIEPALITIEANRGKNTVWVDVVHTGGSPMAVALTVFERELDLDGNQKLDSLARSTEFMVYPAEIILYAGDRARVQIVHRPKGKVTADKAYFLFSKEVPLPIEEEGGGVRVGVSTLMNYYSIISVETGKPGKLTFVSSNSIGGGMVEVIVENRSGGRVGVTDMSIMAGRERITEFTGNKNSVMPGQRRRFTFRYGRPLTAKEFSVGYN